MHKLWPEICARHIPLKDCGLYANSYPCADYALKHFWTGETGDADGQDANGSHVDLTHFISDMWILVVINTQGCGIIDVFLK